LSGWASTELQRDIYEKWNQAAGPPRFILATKPNRRIAKPNRRIGEVFSYEKELS
jgi:hypothetical protein